MGIWKNTNDDCGCGPGWGNSGALDVTSTRDGSAVQGWSFAPTSSATPGRPVLPQKGAIATLQRSRVLWRCRYLLAPRAGCRF